MIVITKPPFVTQPTISLHAGFILSQTFFVLFTNGKAAHSSFALFQARLSWIQIHFVNLWNLIARLREHAERHFNGAAAIRLGGGEGWVWENLISQLDDGCDKVGQTNIVNKCTAFPSHNLNLLIYVVCLLLGWINRCPMIHFGALWVRCERVEVCESHLEIFSRQIPRVSRKRRPRRQTKLCQMVGQPKWRQTSESSTSITLTKLPLGSIRELVSKVKVRSWRRTSLGHCPRAGKSESTPTAGFSL